MCSIPFSVQRGRILILSQNLSKILNCQILNICRVLKYYMYPIKKAHPIIHLYMYTPEFNSYHTAAMRLSDSDYVALNNEHIFFMRWHQTRVKIVGAMEVSC